MSGNDWHRGQRSGDDARVEVRVGVAGVDLSRLELRALERLGRQGGAISGHAGYGDD